MTALGSTIVNWGALGKVVLYSLLASVGVSIAFGLAVRGATRLVEVRRDGRLARAVAYGVVSTAAALASLAAAGYGIYLTTLK